MRKILMAATLGVLMLVGQAATAQQQPRQISARAGAAWSHERSGIALPASVGALRRVGITDSTTSEVDVAAHYEDGQSRVSIILYRPQITDLGLWFDRSEQVLSLNPRLGTATPIEAAPLPIMLGGSSDPIGLRRSYRGTGEWRSTATAMLQSGRWIIKIRASSSNPDIATVTRLVDSALTGITLPRTPRSGATALRAAPMPIRVVQPCTDTVRWSNATAPRDANRGMMSAAMLAITPLAPGQTAEAPADQVPIAATALCRDATQINGMPANVYRVPGNDQNYLLLIGDSGTTIDVRVITRQMEGQLVRLGMVSVMENQRSLAFPPFDALPAPIQAIQLLQMRRPTGVLSFDPETTDERTLQIVSGS
jgi:hypothetical protein